MPSRPMTDEGRERWCGFELAIAGASHVGRIRPSNQDAFDRFDDLERDEILMVIADGMGGHRGGERAARMAVGTLGKLVREGEGSPRERLEAAILRANTEIHRLSQRDSRLRGMGTTLAALLISPDAPVLIAHVGDSRVYRLRAGQLAPLTEDHSLVAKFVREGTLSPEQAREHPSRNQIYQAVGTREEVLPDFTSEEPRSGDAFILCSDGLNSMLDDGEIEELARRSTDPHAVVAWLIDAANQAGGKDNVTTMYAGFHAAEA
jgi:serine/threonine protein phosphatase PrpC